MSEPLYNVVAINIKTGSRRLLAKNKTERDAEAIICMAVARRGLDEEFYKSEIASVEPEGER